MKTEQEIKTEIDNQKEFISYKMKEYNLMMKSLRKTTIDEFNFNDHAKMTEIIFREIERAQRIISSLIWVIKEF